MGRTLIMISFIVSGLVVIQRHGLDLDLIFRQIKATSDEAIDATVN